MSINMSEELHSLLDRILSESPRKLAAQNERCDERHLIARLISGIALARHDDALIQCLDSYELITGARREGVPLPRDQRETSIGSGVEWTGTDGVARFGVVMSSQREDMGAQIVDCTVDTFHGDPLHTVPVEVSRLWPRK